VAWWRERVGFRLTFVQHHPAADSPANYAVVERDDVEVHLARRAEVSDRRRAEITITVADLSALVDELAARRAHPAALPSGAVGVKDPTGNRIVFRRQ